MVKILGLDIGGANTKFAFIDTEKEDNEILIVGSDYFPFWKYNENYPQYLQELKETIEEKFGTIEIVVFVTTAELADCFHTKKEGITTICNYVSSVFTNLSNGPFIYSSKSDFISMENASEQWFEVSATNWIVSANYLGLKYPNIIMIDIGTTTTDIIPINDGKVVAEGYSDLDRLISNELVYTGLLRTNIATILNEVKLPGKIIPVSSELFATTGDAYLIQNLISIEEFTSETADGKSVSKENSLARIARVICADTNQLSENEIQLIAKQTISKQIELLTQALQNVKNRYHERYDINPQIVLMGSGAKPIGISLLRAFGIYEETLIDELLSKEESVSFTAVAVAKLYALTKNNL
ncbi:MAG: hydantoinase/oxoprolinase family protein [Candidatus Heimdallarchaeota archaeon]